MRKQKTEKSRSKCHGMFLVLFLIILLGFSLRFYNLAKESLWFDEIYGGILPAKQSITYLLNPDISLPVSTYHIILHYWMQIFGQSEFSVRFPALIFGVLSIFVIYKLGKVIFNQEIGLLSALILAISPFQIHYSQEARPYSLLMLLSLVSVYYFVKFIKSSDEKNFDRKFNSPVHKILNCQKPTPIEKWHAHSIVNFIRMVFEHAQNFLKSGIRRVRHESKDEWKILTFIKNKKNIGIYMVSTLIGIYTHYFIFFLLIFQNIYFFMYNIKNKKVVKSWLISQCIITLIFLLYSPYFLKYIIFVLNGGLAFLKPYFSLFSIMKTFYVFILDYAFINSNYCIPCFHVNPFIIFLIGIVFLLLIFLGIKNLFDYKKNFKELIHKNEKSIFLILYLIVPILILYTISFIIPLFQVRYVIYSSAPLYILISKGISRFKRRGKLILVVLVLLLFSLVLNSYYNEVTKEQWREASNLIDKFAMKDDVIIYPYSTFVFEYYNVKIDKKILIPNNYPNPQNPTDIFGEPLKFGDIDQITSNHKRAWLVLPPTWELKNYEEITKEFETLILEKEFKGVKIYLFEI